MSAARASRSPPDYHPQTGGAGSQAPPAGFAFAELVRAVPWPGEHLLVCAVGPMWDGLNRRQRRALAGCVWTVRLATVALRILAPPHGQRDAVLAKVARAAGRKLHRRVTVKRLREWRLKLFRSGIVGLVDFRGRRARAARIGIGDPVVETVQCLVGRWGGRGGKG